MTSPQWATKEIDNLRISVAQSVNIETWSLQALNASNMEIIFLLMDNHKEHSSTSCLEVCDDLSEAEPVNLSPALSCRTFRRKRLKAPCNYPLIEKILSMFRV